MQVGIKRNWRNSGGIYIGFRFHFPFTVCNDDCETKWERWQFDIGLVAWTLSVSWKTNVRPEDAND